MAFSQIFDSIIPRRVTLQYSLNGVDRTLLAIDCTESEQMTLESQATQHDIEEGADVSDHVIQKGRTLQLSGIVSDTPIDLTRATIGNLAGYLGDRIGGAAGTIATAGTVIMSNLAMTGSPKPSKAALDIFEEIYAKRTPLTIVAGLSTYTNMVMERFSPRRDVRTAMSLSFTASFRQIRIITGETVTVPREAKNEAVKDLSATEQQQGRKQGSVLDDVQEEKAASWLYQLTQGIGLAD